MSKLNPKLNPGDEIVLVDMDDPYNPVVPGTKGIVTKKFELFGDVQYNVKWENGSTLDLIEGSDNWIYAKDFKGNNLKESESEAEREMNFFMNKIDRFRNYDTRFLREYLMKVRDSGITNMFGSARFLYMGKDRIEHEFYYDEIAEDNPAFDEVLELADKAQSIMVSGVIKQLEEKGKPLEIDLINRELHKAASDILAIFIRLF